MAPFTIVVGLCTITFIFGGIVKGFATDYNILTTTLDYDKAIELCKNNDSVDYIKFNNNNSTQFIKCKNSAEFKVNGK
jgi:hypothetical protein